MKTAYFLTDAERDCIVLALGNEIDNNVDWLDCNKMGEVEATAWKETIAQQREIVSLLNKSGVEEWGTASVTGLKIKSFNERLLEARELK